MIIIIDNSKLSKINIDNHWSNYYSHGLANINKIDFDNIVLDKE